MQQKITFQLKKKELIYNLQQFYLDENIFNEKTSHYCFN